LLYSSELNEFLSKEDISSYFLYSSDSGTYPLEGRDRLSFHFLAVDQNLFNEFMVSGTPFIYIADGDGAVLMRGFVSGPQKLIQLCQQYANSGSLHANLHHSLTSQKIRS
jgi:hypothetical protein